MRIALGSMLLLALVGCRSASDRSEPWTEGDQGRARLGYFSRMGAGSQCFLSCSLEYPIMLGATETITLSDWHRMPPVTVVGTDPSVVEIVEQDLQWTCRQPSLCVSVAATEEDCVRCGGDVERFLQFRARALAVGDVVIELRTDAGEVWESVSLGVREAESVELWRLIPEHRERVSSLRLELDGVAGNNDGSGSEAALWVRPRGADGGWLQASDSPVVTVPDAMVADFGRGASSATGAAIDLYPRARGSTTLTVSANDATLTIPVRVE